MPILDLYPDLRAAASGLPYPACGKPTLILAMTPRTGSTHLATLLSGTGRMAPNEILNIRGVTQSEMARRGATSFAEFIESINADPYPWFGFKTSFEDFKPLSGFYKRLFPDARFAYLRRRDILAQAVSFFRACVSGEWHDPCAAPRDESALAQERARLRETFDILALHGCLKKLEDEVAGWREFFETEGISPCEILYEDVEADAEGVLRRLGEAIGTDFLPAPPAIFRKMADSLNEEWLHQLRLKHLAMT